MNIRLRLAQVLERWASHLRMQDARRLAHLRQKRHETCRRDKSLLTFISVAFKEDGYPYTYLADEDSYQVGDRVRVPVGEYGHMSCGIVTQVQHLPPEEAPYPLDRIKRVGEIVQIAPGMPEAEQARFEAKRQWEAACNSSEQADGFAYAKAFFGEKFAGTDDDEGVFIAYEDFRKALELNDVDEAQFHFAGERVSHRLGNLMNGSRSYWIDQGEQRNRAGFSTGTALLQAEIFEGRSLEQRWNEVRFYNIDGMDADDWRDTYITELEI